MRDKRRKNSNRLAKSKVVAWLILITVVAGCNQQPAQKTAMALDTICTVSIYKGDKNLLKSCFQLINQLEIQLDWRNDLGDVYKINHSTDWVTISADTYDCLKLGRDISEKSGGVFDITALALTGLYDFHNQVAPSQQQIQQQLDNVGWEYLELQPNRARITKAGVMIDLGGIAKGYIADKVREYLVSKNVKRALINLGGNIHTITDGQPFKIGVQKPFAPLGEYFKIVELQNEAVATSGISERTFQQDGITYHHVLDLKTGQPAQTEIQSFTVITDNAAQADAVSTVGLIQNGQNIIPNARCIPYY